MLDSRSGPHGSEKDTSERHSLFFELSPILERRLWRVGADAETREDWRGEGYVRFCELLDTYDPHRGIPLRCYLVQHMAFGMSTLMRRHWRRRQREIGLDRMDDIAAAGSTEADVLGRVHRENLAARLSHALAGLPRQQRRAVVLRYIEERGFEEIAEHLGVQPSTARSLLRHGLAKLRRALATES